MRLHGYRFQNSRDKGEQKCDGEGKCFENKGLLEREKAKAYGSDWTLQIK